jgi:hypothetical protein
MQRCLANWSSLSHNRSLGEKFHSNTTKQRTKRRNNDIDTDAKDGLNVIAVYIYLKICCFTVVVKYSKPHVSVMF